MTHHSSLKNHFLPILPVPVESDLSKEEEKVLQEANKAKKQDKPATDNLDEGEGDNKEKKKGGFLRKIFGKKEKSEL